MVQWADKPGAMPLYRMRINNEEQGYRGSNWAVEVLAGDVASADAAPRRLRRIIDRRSDRYVEQVIDNATGQIIRDVDERLSAHRGRGSAKPELRETRTQPYRRRGARRS